MIPFLLIGGFGAEGKWIRPVVFAMTRDGLSGNSLVPVNLCKVCICCDVHIKQSLTDWDRGCFTEAWTQLWGL